ncbi:FlgB family protein [Tropicimonas sediminicola]|uniref:Flagellar basal-body rod protein FlgB n=1 Tax=Tropicimonas sediminicola TaxID=1031541 RepID=A0A239JBK1_9RHOB|nr:FlgB family protein [Tropicimonas sediminicola]SNT03406.1 flagellar basal-body rod protein FlgB [Tropicimonas sediminicola]
MFENLEILRLAQGMAQHAVTRQSVVARNLANVDTPGYQQRDIASFAEVWQQSDSAAPLQRTRESHLDWGSRRSPPDAAVIADATSEPNGNSVSVETEIMKSVEVRQQHDIALSIYRSSLNVLRASLGR